MRLLLLTALLASCCAPQMVGGKLVPVRPNIVLVVIDDLGWTDLGCQGSLYYETPNIDRLAKEGAQLDRFSVFPICSPTRTALMTGRSPASTSSSVSSPGNWTRSKSPRRRTCV